jgi:hypothetical protein
MKVPNNSPSILSSGYRIDLAMAAFGLFFCFTHR